MALFARLVYLGQLGFSDEVLPETKIPRVGGRDGACTNAVLSSLKLCELSNDG